MKSIIFISKRTTIKEVEIKNKKIDKDILIESFDIRDTLEYIGSWNIDSYHYVVFSHKDGNAGSENKYELPPPFDSILLFNEIIIVKCKKLKNNCCSKLENINSHTWKRLYNTLYGGTVNLEESESESESESYDEESVSYTKSGYIKDGFVVSDSESDDEISFDDGIKYKNIRSKSKKTSCFNNELCEEDYETDE